MSQPDSSTPDDRPTVAPPLLVPALVGSRQVLSPDASDREASVEPDQETIVLAEVVEEPPRLWPTFLMATVAIGGALVVSGIALGIFGALAGGVEMFRDPQQFNRWLSTFAATDKGLAVLVVPGQLTFCLVVLIAAAFSRERPADRLGLRRGRLALWTWPLFLFGTPVVGIATAQVMSQFMGEASEQLQMLEKLFAQHATGSIVMLLVLISLLPGFAEELLFRGFLQRRLLARLPEVAAIGITTAFFAAAHVDPMHAVGVIPLGIWLGIVAWRADSIWPAVFGHVGNNAYAVVMSVMMGPDPSPQEISPAVVGTLGLALLAFLGCLALLSVPRPRAGSSPRPAASPQAIPIQEPPDARDTSTQA
ncbi:MAG: CPBP family intramembrane glutamic endopeptidase [Pirellulaceae bacterium]